MVATAVPFHDGASSAYLQPMVNWQWPAEAQQEQQRICCCLAYVLTWLCVAPAGTMTQPCVLPLRSTGMMPSHLTWQHQTSSTCERSRWQCQLFSSCVGNAPASAQSVGLFTWIQSNRQAGGGGAAVVSRLLAGTDLTGVTVSLSQALPPPGSHHPRGGTLGAHLDLHGQVCGC